MRRTVQHACGHSTTVNLVGSASSREWRLERMKHEVCFDCYHQAAYVQAQDEVLRLKQTSGIPALFKNRTYSRSWVLATEHPIPEEDVELVDMEM